MLKLKFLLLVPSLALGATQKFEAQDAAKIYEALNVSEVTLEEHDVPDYNRCHFWNVCPEELISIKEKRILGLNCKKMEYSFYDLMANGEIIHRIKYIYECLKNYNLNKEKINLIYGHLDGEEKVIYYDNEINYLKDFDTFILEKEENIVHNMVHLNFYHKKLNYLYHNEAKNLFNILQVPIVIDSYYEFKELDGFMCRKTVKNFRGEKLKKPEYFCEVKALIKYKFQ